MTPLMAKLSMAESYSFAASTESLCRTPSTSILPQNNFTDHQKLLLFVAGVQNTSLMVLLEKEAENDADLIHQLVNITIHNLCLYLLFNAFFLNVLVEFKHQISWKFGTLN